MCPSCAARFTTFERVQLRELVVLKRSGRRVAFEREKLERSINIALRKRNINAERVEQMISGIVRQLESQGEPEVSSSVIGELVMAALQNLDQVAFIRYASVYKDFTEVRDFKEIVDGLAEEPPKAR
jgi:transcriptional repressor NrdR